MPETNKRDYTSQSKKVSKRVPGRQKPAGGKASTSGDGRGQMDGKFTMTCKGQMPMGKM